MNVIIDRFEGDFAVCEKNDRTMMDIPRKSIPPEAKEGDILIVSTNQIIIDVEGTKKRRELIKKLFDSSLK